MVCEDVDVRTRQDGAEEFEAGGQAAAVEHRHPVGQHRLVHIHVIADNGADPSQKEGVTKTGGGGGYTFLD